MARAKSYNLICLLCVFILLHAPASTQELRRDSSRPHITLNSQAVNAQDEKDSEQKLWDSIKEGSNPQEFKTFLTKYPHGQFRDAARTRLSALLGQEYVSLFTKRLDVNRHWPNVEQQLLRRANIIPALVGSLQAAGVQEQELYGQIAEARARLLSIVNAAPQAVDGQKTPEQKRSVIDAANNFNEALRRFDALPENYPQLRSNENVMLELNGLVGAGNRVAVARADYNRAVLEYNNARNETRTATTAEAHGFTEEPFFESDHERPLEPKIKPAPSSHVHVDKPGGAA